VKFNLKGVVDDMDRHGNVCRTSAHQGKKKKVHLRERPGSVEFHERGPVLDVIGSGHLRSETS
jgi:hypothetical protein